MKKKIQKYILFALSISFVLAYSEQVYKEKDLKEDTSTMIESVSKTGDTVLTEQDKILILDSLYDASSTVLSKYAPKGTYNLPNGSESNSDFNGVEASLIHLLEDEQARLNIKYYLEHNNIQGKPTEESDSPELIWEDGVAYITLKDLDFSLSTKHKIVLEGQQYELDELTVPVTQKSMKNSTLFDFEFYNAYFDDSLTKASVVFKSTSGILLEVTKDMKTLVIQFVLYRKEG